MSAGEAVTGTGAGAGGPGTDAAHAAGATVVVVVAGTDVVVGVAGSRAVVVVVGATLVDVVVVDPGDVWARAGAVASQTAITQDAAVTTALRQIGCDISYNPGQLAGRRGRPTRGYCTPCTGPEGQRGMGRYPFQK
jgi:hypothetical protein